MRRAGRAGDEFAQHQVDAAAVEDDQVHGGVQGGGPVGAAHHAQLPLRPAAQREGRADHVGGGALGERVAVRAGGQVDHGDVRAVGRLRQHDQVALVGGAGAQRVVPGDEPDPLAGQRVDVQVVELEAVVDLAAVVGGALGGARHPVRLLELVERAADLGLVGGGEHVQRRGEAGGEHLGVAGVEPVRGHVPAPRQAAAPGPHLAVEGDAGRAAGAVHHRVGEAAVLPFARGVEQAGEDHGQVGGGTAAPQRPQRGDAGGADVVEVAPQQVVHLAHRLVEGQGRRGRRHEHRRRGERADDAVGGGGQAGPVAGGEDHRAGRGRAGPGQRLGERGQQQGRRRDAEPVGAGAQGGPPVRVELAAEPGAPPGRAGGGPDRHRGGRQGVEPGGPVRQVGRAGGGVAFGREEECAVAQRQGRRGGHVRRVGVEAVPVGEQHGQPAAVDREAVHRQVHDGGVVRVEGDLHRRERFAEARHAVLQAVAHRAHVGGEGVRGGVAPVVHRHGGCGVVGQDPLGARLGDDEPQRVVVRHEPVPRGDQPVAVGVGDGELAVDAAADRVVGQLRVAADDVRLLEGAEGERLRGLAGGSRRCGRRRSRCGLCRRRVLQQPVHQGAGIRVGQPPHRHVGAQPAAQFEHHAGARDGVEPAFPEGSPGNRFGRGEHFGENCRDNRKDILAMCRKRRFHGYLRICRPPGG
ncbi:hypothetical protein NUG22_29205 [Saccharothrix longispora]|nr:hypothetical protein [Saccharothrix longispora]MDU0293307.1 hypothetical protein [Saccharothrix longispora]